MNNKHGGKRAGAGRPKGSTSIPSELREAARSHTKVALDAITSIVNDATAQPSERLKAADMLLTRAHGKPTELPEPIVQPIIQRFIDGELTALNTALLIESVGERVPDLLQQHVKREIDRFDHFNKTDFLEPKAILPKH